MGMMPTSMIGGNIRLQLTHGGDWRIFRVRTRWEPLPTQTAHISIACMVSAGDLVPICCAMTSLPIHGRLSTAATTRSMPLWQERVLLSTSGTFSVLATIHIVSTNGMKLIFRVFGQNESMCRVSGKMPFVRQVPAISIWQTGNILVEHSPMGRSLMTFCVMHPRQIVGLAQDIPPRRQSTVSVSLSMV